MTSKQRWANRQEAMLFAKQAEKDGKLGLSYVSACDFLGWDISIRREIMAKEKRRGYRHE